MRCLFPACALIWACALAWPAGHPLAQTIRGIGTRPCAEWSQARAGGGHDFEAEQWVTGYVSAISATSRDGTLSRPMDERTLFSGIDGYCDGHPAQILWDAVKAVLATSHGS